MEPDDIAARYDQIAQWWQTQHQDSPYGIAQLERAIKFTSLRHSALDVGCDFKVKTLSTALWV